MAHCIPTYMLASGLMAAGHELVAGALHDPARQHDRAGPDPAQLASRHEVRHSVPGVRARRLRHDRLEPAGAHARDRRVRLVRHPGLDRRRGAPDVLQRRSCPAGRPCWARASPATRRPSGSRSCSSGASTSSIIYRGMDLLRKVENWAAPFVLVMTAVLLGWAITRGARPRAAARAAGQVPHASATFWPVFVPSLTGMIGFWATLSLNMPDFTRFGRSQREQMRRPDRRAADDDVRVRGDGRPDHQRDRRSSTARRSGTRSSSSAASRRRSWSSRSRCSRSSSPRSPSTSPRTSSRPPTISRTRSRG